MYNAKGFLYSALRMIIYCSLNIFIFSSNDNIFITINRRILYISIKRLPKNPENSKVNALLTPTNVLAIFNGICSGINNESIMIVKGMVNI